MQLQDLDKIVFTAKEDNERHVGYVSCYSDPFCHSTEALENPKVYCSDCEKIYLLNQITDIRLIGRGVFDGDSSVVSLLTAMIQDSRSTRVNGLIPHWLIKKLFVCFDSVTHVLRNETGTGFHAVQREFVPNYEQVGTLNVGNEPMRYIFRDDNAQLYVCDTSNPALTKISKDDLAEYFTRAEFAPENNKLSEVLS